MSDHERSLDEVLRELRSEYNAPPETPREEMWQVVRAGLPGRREADVVELSTRRSPATPGFRRMAGWAVAAAALVVLGVGIGRMSTPGVQETEPSAVTAEAAPAPAASGALRAAARQHLEGTETLLTVVRSDARSGELDPRLRTMARGMLAQTRLFLDASEGGDREMRRLMEDLELVLAQIVSVTEDGSRTRTELDLALRGLEDRELMTRIRTLSGPGLAGT